MSIPNNINPSSININEKSKISNDIKSKIQSGKEAAQSKIQSGKDKLNNLKKQIDTAKGKVKNKNPFKDLNQPSSFLKDQVNISPNDARSALIGLITPLLTKFISSEYVFDTILNKLIKNTKTQLKDKGKVTVNGTTITFTPKNPGDYIIYKRNFEISVNKLKELVALLQKIVSTLNTILSAARLGLATLKITLNIKQAKLKAQSIAASAELSTPSPIKPTTSTYIISDRLDNDTTPKLLEKIDKYMVLITAIKSFLKIFEKILKSLKTKLDTLKFLVISSENQNMSNIGSNFEDTTSLDALKENKNTYISTTGKSYDIEITTTPSGALQAIAYDSFSRMKITQTAPSRTRGVNELFNEIKQILG